jgi:hypothetical protein
VRGAVFGIGYDILKRLRAERDGRAAAVEEQVGIAVDGAVARGFGDGGVWWVG